MRRKGRKYERTLLSPRRALSHLLPPFRPEPNVCIKRQGTPNKSTRMVEKGKGEKREGPRCLEMGGGGGGGKQTREGGPMSDETPHRVKPTNSMLRTLLSRTRHLCSMKETLFFFSVPHLQFCPHRLHLHVVFEQQAFGRRLQLMVGGMHRRRFTNSCADRE